MTTAQKLVSGIALLLVAASGGYLAGRGTRTVTTESHTTTVGMGDVQSSSRVARTQHRGASVRERFDPHGNLVERLTLGAVDTSTHRQDAQEARTATRVETGTSTRTEPAKSLAPRFRLSLGLSWESPRLDLRPRLSVGGEMRLTPPVLGVAPWVFLNVEPPGVGPTFSNSGSLGWGAGVRVVGSW